MKRLATTLGVLLVAAAVAAPVMAWGPGWGRDGRMMGGGGYGPGYCWDRDRASTDLTPDQKAKLDELEDKFSSETRELRSQLWSKQEELEDVMEASTPDVERAKALQKEITDLRAKLSDKRLDYELEARKIAPEAGTKYGRGYGRGMRGFGPGRGPYGPASCH